METPRFMVAGVDTASKAAFKSPDRTAYVYSDSDSDARMGAGVCEIPPGSSNSRHTHMDEDEVIYVLSGRIRFEFPTESVTLQPLQAIYIERGLEHQIFNDGTTPAWHTFTFSSGDAAALIKRMYR